MVQAQTLAVDLFRDAYYPQGLSPTTAWLGIYQVLLWYAPVMLGGINALPHIIDANNFRQPGPWVNRAREVERYLAQHLHCQPAEVPTYLDQLMSHPVYRGRQRQNPLGKAFPALVGHILRGFGNSSVAYDLDVPAIDIFPGVAVPGRGQAPEMDLVVLREGRPRAIISAKWSLRHDRLNDITNECPAYKGAASWTRSTIDYIVMTNEFNPARLQRLLRDPCVDAVVHVHKPAVVEICGLDGRLQTLTDLTDLIDRSHRW